MSWTVVKELLVGGLQLLVGASVIGVFAVIWLLLPPGTTTGHVVVDEDPQMVVALEDAAQLEPGVTGWYFVNRHYGFSGEIEQDLPDPTQETYLMMVATDQPRIVVWATCSHEIRHAELAREGTSNITRQHEIMRQEGFAGWWQYRIDPRCLKIR